jgi:gas vesicle protein
MSDEKGYSGAQIILAFFAGAVTGTCLALLAAPQSGSETRGAIRGWTRDAGGRALRLPEALRRAYREAAGAAKQAFNDALSEGPDPH